MKGGINHRGKLNVAFLWNVMDHKSRYLLASKLSKDRDIKGAVQAFKEAIKNAHGLEPKILTTDALTAYPKAVEQTFESKVWHKARQGVNKPHANNNRIERNNGTQRERIKVQRGWKSIETPLPEGLRIHMNCVKPHMALQGRSPAQKLGIMIEKAKWMDLLEFAISKNGSKKQMS